jgi:hypothetical protein
MPVREVPFTFALSSDFHHRKVVPSRSVKVRGLIEPRWGSWHTNGSAKGTKGPAMLEPTAAPMHWMPGSLPTNAEVKYKT